MPIDLSDLEETCSLLIPAYGITHDVPAALADFGSRHLIGPAKDEEETYGLLHRDDWYVQPRGTAHFLFGASALFNDAIMPAGERRVVRLREAAEPMPEGRANTCLMVQGMRSCVRRRADRSEFVRGYAAWTGPPGAHRWVSQTGFAADAASPFRSKTVSFGRVGRCALYAPLGDGKARILLLDFRVVDRDADAPDLLFVWSSRADVRLGDIPHHDPRGERLSDEWHALILDAIEGHQSEQGP